MRKTRKIREDEMAETRTILVLGCLAALSGGVGDVAGSSDVPGLVPAVGDDEIEPLLELGFEVEGIFLGGLPGRVHCGIS